MPKPKARPRTAKRDPSNPERALISPMLADDLFNAYRTAARWSEEYEKLRAEVESLAGDATEVYDTDGRPVVMGRVPGKASRFDQAAFKEAHPDLYAEFVKLNPTKAPFKPVGGKGSGES